jgi:rhamnosyltransferase
MAFPKVAILLASYNGLNWLQEQIDSILAQVDVSVTIFISDDNSTDGTLDFIRAIALLNNRIILLPLLKSSHSSGHNFYRLIRDVNFDSFDYVGFADQDDIWFNDKLSTQINILKTKNADAVSSNVIAFWPNGSERLIIKSQRQRSLDFIFESAGPGCSYLLCPWILVRVRQQLLLQSSQARYVNFHDWLVYAVARSYGAKWIIYSKPLLKYRQHQANVLGANVGILSKLSRFVKVCQGLYRNEVSKIAQVSASISFDPKVVLVNDLIKKNNIISNIRMLFFVNHARRSFLDRISLAFFLIAFVF